MKRIILGIIALALAALLISCSGSEKIAEAEALINRIKIPSEESLVLAEEAYAALSEKQRAEVANYNALVRARELTDAMHSRSWALEKAQSRIDALSCLDLTDPTPFEGSVYRFREIGKRAVGYIDVGNYNNVIVRADYAMTIEFNVRIDDYDAAKGYPIMAGYVNSEDGPEYAVGYDFVEGCFFTGSLTRMSEGIVKEYRQRVSVPFTLGVWHHVKIVYRQASVAAYLDGEEVLTYQYAEGIGYRCYIFYPQWIDALFANVVFTSGTGVVTKNAFDMSHAAEDGGWSTTVISQETVGESNRSAVAAARNAYDFLSEEERGRTENSSALISAEKLLNADQTKSPPPTDR